jgi:hypothetical protein
MKGMASRSLHSNILEGKVIIDRDCGTYDVITGIFDESYHSAGEEVVGSPAIDYLCHFFYASRKLHRVPPLYLFGILPLFHSLLSLLVGDAPVAAARISIQSSSSPRGSNTNPQGFFEQQNDNRYVLLIDRFVILPPFRGCRLSFIFLFEILSQTTTIVNKLLFVVPQTGWLQARLLSIGFVADAERSLFYQHERVEGSEMVVLGYEFVANSPSSWENMLTTLQSKGI